MKKFILLHYGFETPTEEIMEAWGSWFASISEITLDPGQRFGPGKEITSSGTQDLPYDLEAITGYTIIQAEDMDAAERIASTCPSITAIRVYELMSS
jgi:hypothetical protein